MILCDGARIAALEHHASSRSRAVQALGIDRTTLYRTMRDFGIGRYGKAG